MLPGQSGKHHVYLRQGDSLVLQFDVEAAIKSSGFMIQRP